jgi:hypothetical protein
MPLRINQSGESISPVTLHGDSSGDEADSSVTAINVGELHMTASEPPLPLRSIASHQPHGRGWLSAKTAGCCSAW